MSEKSVQISVRISERDAEFLSRLQIEDATSHSEKVRALLRQARLQREGLQDFASELDFLNGLHRSGEARRLALEKDWGRRSDLLRVLGAWIVETDAFLLSATPNETSPSPGAEAEREALLALEAGASDRVAALFDQVMRLSITATCAGYSPTIVREKMRTLVELMAALHDTYEREGKEAHYG